MKPTRRRFLSLVGSTIGACALGWQSLRVNQEDEELEYEWHRVDVCNVVAPEVYCSYLDQLPDNNEHATYQHNQTRIPDLGELGGRRLRTGMEQPARQPRRRRR